MHGDQCVIYSHYDSTPHHWATQWSKIPSGVDLYGRHCKAHVCKKVDVHLRICTSYSGIASDSVVSRPDVVLPFNVIITHLCCRLRLAGRRWTCATSDGCNTTWRWRSATPLWPSWLACKSRESFTTSTLHHYPWFDAFPCRHKLLGFQVWFLLFCFVTALYVQS